MLKTVHISSLTKIFEEGGFRVYENHHVEGISGLKHHFDIVAIREDKTICIVFNNTTTALLSVVGKAVDLPKKEIIVITKNAEELLDLNIKNLKILELNSSREIIEELEKMI